MDQHEKVVIVTGASSGIGNACATHLAKKGLRVFGTCRNPSSYMKKADEFFEMIAMDVTDNDSVNKAVAAVLEKAGRIDAILCNAGMGIAGSIEDSSMEEILLQINTNFLGAVRSVKAVLPAMRAAGTGKILVLSSIAGVVGMPFQAFYSASKYAIEGMMESLRYEVRPFGLQACLIEPGDFRTGFTAARRYVKKADDSSAYKKYFEPAMAVQVRDESQGFDPLVAAKLVFKLIEAPRLPVRTTVGPGFERFAVIVKRLIPARWFEKFYRMYYKLP
ncbi:MAG TPA: SDR family oxidoreductase [Rectinemataceae bacterium]|nr:SDR family oxidoreductase [Rectinemataceae bacterium]